jgi:GntR family transcriptional regulator
VGVDHDAADPPYFQVAAFLRERIRSGDLPPGARVPSISYLMGQYGIARNTARRALKELEAEGLVEIRQGWGTFVARPQSLARSSARHINTEAPALPGPTSCCQGSAGRALDLLKERDLTDSCPDVRQGARCYPARAYTCRLQIQPHACPVLDVNLNGVSPCRNRPVSTSCLYIT